MLDKDKLILVCQIGLAHIKQIENQYEYFREVGSQIRDLFDDSVVVLVSPNFEVVSIQIAKLNFENYSEEYVDSLMKKATEFVEMFRASYSK